MKIQKPSKQAATIVIIIMCVVLVLGIKTLTAASRGELSNAKLARMKGDTQAPIKIIEFLDFQCPSCANGSKFLKKYMQEHPGKILLQVKYFPLSRHQHAFLSSYYAECAARQSRFWDFQDRLIEQQAKWDKLQDVRPFFDLLAKEAGLDLQELKSCVTDESVQSVVLADKEEGKKLGVQSTPTYFVNDEMMVGVSPLEKKLDLLIAPPKSSSEPKAVEPAQAPMSTEH